MIRDILLPYFSPLKCCCTDFFVVSHFLVVSGGFLRLLQIAPFYVNACTSHKLRVCIAVMLAIP